MKNTDKSTVNNNSTIDETVIQGVRDGHIYADTQVRDSGFVMHGHHCHSCYELFYVEEGDCRFLVEEQIYDLQAGDFILLPPNVLHYTRYMFGVCERTVILFQLEDISEEIRRYMPSGIEFFARPQVFQVPLNRRRYIHACLIQISEEKKPGDPRSDILRLLVLRGLLLLCTLFCKFLSDPPDLIHTTDPHILQAAQYICENYMNQITSEDIAQDVGFTPNYLSRRFREETGIGLHEYLVFIRLHHAAQELILTTDSVTQIALRCGFSGSNYFKDAFKKKYGVTPREYRKAV